MRKRRRHLLLAACGATALGALSSCRFSLEQGFTNPCRAALPRRLAEHDIVRAAWDGIDANKVWDCHAHLIGTGDSGGGIWINPRMGSVLNPVQFAQRLFYLNAGCAHDAPGEVDSSYIERMRNLVDGMRPGFKLLLLAFDRHFNGSGEAQWDETTFYIPDAYAQQMVQRHPKYFEWAASIHPYRRDCVAALAAAKKNGARAVKWLPAAMGIDPAAPRCDPFYAALQSLDMPLITHAGMERAVAVSERQGLGNPLLLRRALENGVRVVVAHCATMGQDRDLDRGANGPFVDSFELFARLMNEARYERTLYGDLSAVTQLNRAGPALGTLIQREDWHPRLLNGSDYPLPGIMPLYSVDYMVQMKFIAPELAIPLSEIREHNPLLFDFVLKRHLQVAGTRLPPRVFETRPFFAG